MTSGGCSNKLSFPRLLGYVGRNDSHATDDINVTLGGTRSLKCCASKEISPQRLRTKTNLLYIQDTLRHESTQRKWQKRPKCNLGRMLALTIFKLLANRLSALPNDPASSRQRSNTARSIKNSNGVVRTDKEDILGKWREYFEDILVLVIRIQPDTHFVYKK